MTVSDTIRKRSSTRGYKATEKNPLKKPHPAIKTEWGVVVIIKL